VDVDVRGLAAHLTHGEADPGVERALACVAGEVEVGVAHGGGTRGGRGVGGKGRRGPERRDQRGDRKHLVHDGLQCRGGASALAQVRK
jgi:hypothetical protein